MNRFVVRDLAHKFVMASITTPICEPNVCKQLANLGVRVIVAGLDMDYTGKPFGPMPDLLAMAEYVTKVHAICMSCGNLAYVSHRKTTENKLVMLGETESYEPLCRSCFNRNLEKGNVQS